MEEWRFVFSEDTKKETIDTGVASVLGTGIEEQSKNKKNVGFDVNETFTKMLEKNGEDLLKQNIISPLNTATGGLVNNFYKAGKQLINGMALGNVATGLAVGLSAYALQKGLEALENRIQKLEKQSTELNNTDNVLLRSGSVSQATYYSSNIFGIKKKTDRS